MKPRVRVRQLSGKQLLGTARNHAVITDRKIEDGGTDTGCTSGELLLLAMGSCAAGSLRSYFERKGAPCAGMDVEVFFEPPAAPGARDRIVIALGLDEHVFARELEAIKAAATSGGVNSRMMLGSEIEVRFAGREVAAGQ
jgi:hypothetical protein